MYIDSRVISNYEIDKDYGRISLEAPEIAAIALPGQFVMMKYWQGLTPFFMRPFSINSEDTKSGTIEILYKVVGEGTAILKKLQNGEKVQILGPLGNSFPLKDNFKRIAIIGRGVGAAPMRFLSEYARKKNVEVHVFISAAKPEFLFDTTYFQTIECQFIGCCDDRQMVTAYFEEELKQSRFDAAYVCGSKRLIGDVKRLMDQYGFEGYASLEAHMACGIGACKGCTVVINEEGTERFARVCKEGPIFPVRNLVY